MSASFEKLKAILNNPDPKILEQIRVQDLEAALPQKWLRLTELIQNNTKGESIHFTAAEKIVKGFINEVKHNLEDQKQEVFYFLLVKELLNNDQFREFVLTVNEIYPRV